MTARKSDFQRWFNEGGTIYDETGIVVAYVVIQDEDDSDARLMAAAPEMIEALKLAEGALKNTKAPAASKRALPAIRAAIASGKGNTDRTRPLADRTTPAKATQRKTATEMVHGEIDKLAKLNVLTPERARTLKDRLTKRVIEHHARDGLTTRDMIDMYNDLANP